MTQSHRNLPAWTIQYRTPASIGEGTSSGATLEEAVTNLKKRLAYWTPEAIEITGTRQIREANTLL